MTSSRFGRIYVALLFLLTALAGGQVQPPVAHADGPRPRALIPVIGARPAGGVEGSTEHAPQEGNDPYADPNETMPNGEVGQSVQQRATQLTDDGYDVEVRYFSSLQAFLCWLWCEVKAGHTGVYTLVEFYGHGNSDGPAPPNHEPPYPPTGLTPAAPGSGPGHGMSIDKLWEWLGTLLGMAMTGNGHIVFGWCGSTDASSAGKRPGGVVAGKSGRPVYGPSGLIKFPFGQGSEPGPGGAPPLQPYEPGAPFSQPGPQGTDPTPGDPEHPTSKWRRFPPCIPDGEGGTKPNDGNSAPDPVSREGRGSAGLPVAPGVGPTGPEGGPDPLSGRNPQPPAAPGVPCGGGEPPANPPPTFPTPANLPTGTQLGCPECP